MNKNDFAGPNSLEFFSRDGVTLEFFKDGRRELFTEESDGEIHILGRDMIKHPDFIKELLRVGIIAHFEQVKQYGICFHGDLNFTPDFVNGLRTDSEFYCCDNYDSCKLKHKPCRDLVATFGVITRTEREVIKCVALEMTDKEMGEKLFKSTNTIKSHIRNILSKTDRKTKVGIVIFGIKSGIIDVTEL